LDSTKDQNKYGAETPSQGGDKNRLLEWDWAFCLLPLSKDNRKHKQVTCLLTAQMLLLPACTVTKSQAWAAASHTYTYPSNTPLKNKTLDSDPGHLTAINPILCQRWPCLAQELARHPKHTSDPSQNPFKKHPVQHNFLP
jgi:hypothetical protein